MTVSPMDFSLIVKALDFAAKKHRDQRRKNAHASPYINHPIAVMRILWEEGGVREPTLLVAAILHDTLENTETTPEELDQLFGVEIREIVQEVTDDKSLPKQERKELQVEHAAMKSRLAKQLKVADKISNIRDILYDPPTDWDHETGVKYINWAEAVFAGLQGVNLRLDNLFRELVATGKKCVSFKHKG